MGGLQGWHIVIIVVLALILFGAPKLPGLARSLGQSMRIFKSEVRQMKDDDPKDPKDPKDPHATEEPFEGKVVDPDHRGPQL